jgi:hypothetical protein
MNNMHTQTKNFIALGDIASFRFRCKSKGCCTELSLPLQENYSLTKPADWCPNCGAGWLKISDVTDVSAAPLLEQLVAAIRSIPTWPGQCQISLEIKPEPSSQ